MTTATPSFMTTAIPSLPLSEGDDLYIDGNTLPALKALELLSLSTVLYSPRTGSRAASCMQSSPQQTTSTLAEGGFEPNQHWRLSPCQSSAIARRPATRKKRSVRPRSNTTTRTTRRVPSEPQRPPSAASSLARGPKLACACQPEGGHVLVPLHQQKVLHRLA